MTDNTPTLMDQFTYFNTQVQGILNDETTALQQKVKALVNFYIDMIVAYPEVSAFVFKEAKANPDKLVQDVKVIPTVNSSVMARQISEALAAKGTDIHPQHIIMNIISMCVFPLTAGGLIKRYGNLDQTTYEAMMQERKTLIPQWIDALLGLPSHS